MSKVNIGISVLINKQTESFFTNGLRQNAIIMRDLYKKIEYLNSLILIFILTYNIHYTSYILIH